jgi:hypothetical protein
MARLRGRPPADDFLAHAATFPPMLLHTLGTILDEFADVPPAASPHWASAEMDRRRGNLALSRGKTKEGKRALASALHVARRQGARAWELRAATSLAEADRDDEDALATLHELLGTFDEDDASLDVGRARALASRRPVAAMRTAIRAVNRGVAASPALGDALLHGRDHGGRASRPRR